MIQHLLLPPEGVTRVVRAGLMAVLSTRKTEEGSHPPATVTFVTTRPNFSTQRPPLPTEGTTQKIVLMILPCYSKVKLLS